jgi:hypothetical protein
MGTVEEEIAREEGTKGRIPPPPGMDGKREGPPVPPAPPVPPPPMPPGYYQPWGGWYAPQPQPCCPPRRSGKPKMVGVLLMFSGVLSIIMGLFFGAMMVNVVPWMEEWSNNTSGFGDIEGQVIYMNSTPAAGVNVTLVDLNLVASTNETGHYRLLNVANGWHDLRVEAPGYKSFVKSVFVQASDMMGAGWNTTRADFQLQPGSGEQRLGEARTPGSKTGPMDPNAQEMMRTFGAVCMVLGLVLGAFTILGGYYAFRTEKLAVVALGTLCGILSLGFVIGSGLAFIALILLLLSTDEFERAKKEKQSAA